MPRLIHLNGPPGIGKSTIAELYVDGHPGTLNLDIDQIRRLVGGWREDFVWAGGLVRPIALNMAATHLRQGFDVVMPQYLGQISELEKFEAVANASAAEFCEIILLDTKERSVARFNARGLDAEQPWHHQVQEIVERAGGSQHLAELHDQLMSLLEARPNSIVIDSEPGQVHATFARVLAILNDEDVLRTFPPDLS